MRDVMLRALSTLMALCVPVALSAAGAEHDLVRASTPRAVIVVGDAASAFERSLAEELNRYVSGITGVALPVTTPAALSKGAAPDTRGTPLRIAIGQPGTNTLVRDAARGASLRFDTLKKDGFYLWQSAANSRPTLVVGGATEAATMYAVYDLAERLGVVFQIVKDILPEKRDTLTLPALRVKAETPFPDRGLLISNIYPSRGMMDLAEVKQMLDQMAKLKMNHLQFFWFEHEPWLDYTYRGESKLLGDATGPETGYLTWRYNYGSQLVKDVTVGRGQFKGKKKIAPAEFQDVETPAQAFRVAKQFLTELIRHAHARKIAVWLAIDPTTLQANHARFAQRATNKDVPFDRILGTHMCPGDPELHKINEVRLKAMVETYPEADGHYWYLPEMFPDCPADASFLISRRGAFDGLLANWAPYTAYERDPSIVLDSNIGSIHIVQQMLAARDRIAPGLKIGVGGAGRGFVLPIMDKLFDKSIPLSDMESSAVWTPGGAPMELFGNMGSRQRMLLPRTDDDGAMFGMQFSLGLYMKDRVLSGSVANGVTGLVSQMNRPRGFETNYSFIAQGAWNPTLTPAAFYERYAAKLFGEAARADMQAAFATLEEHEALLGWDGRGNFPCCGPPQEIWRAHDFYRQRNPFDGPENWKAFMSLSHDQVRAFTKSQALLAKAIEAFDRAETKVAPRGREELRYLRNKTEAYRQYLRTLTTVRQAYIAFDEAFRLRKSPAEPAFLKRLDEAMALFVEARDQGRATVETFAALIDHTSDRGILYRADLFLVTGLSLVEQTMRNVYEYHHGRDYTKTVAWDKIFIGFPTFGRSR